jgi:hypothetical protein
MNSPETKASTLPQKLRMKADMIKMGERIAWGSEINLMYEAADYIEALAKNTPPDGDKVSPSEMLADIMKAKEALEIYATSDNGAYQILRGFKARTDDKCPNSPANKALATLEKYGEK